MLLTDSTHFFSAAWNFSNGGVQAPRYRAAAHSIIRGYGARIHHYVSQPRRPRGKAAEFGCLFGLSYCMPNGDKVTLA